MSCPQKQIDTGDLLVYAGNKAYIVINKPIKKIRSLLSHLSQSLLRLVLAFLGTSGLRRIEKSVAKLKLLKP